MMAAQRSARAMGGPFYLAAGLWLLALVFVVLTLLAIYLFDWSHAHADFRPDASDTVATLPIMAFATVGALIAWQQPRNRIGWLLIITAITAVLLQVPKLYAGLAIDQHLDWLPAPLWAYWFGQFAWVFAFLLFLVFLPLLYPDGHLPGPRWRLVLLPAAAITLVAIVGALDPASAPAELPNPAGVAALTGITEAVIVPFLILVFGTSLAAIASLVARYRRGAERDRQQLKWLMAAAGLMLVAFVAGAFVPGETTVVADVALPVAVTAMPIAIGIAIMRYRLYDIDVLISKAIVYGGLAAVITAVYILVVINIGAMIGGSQRLWLSLLATAVIALAFQPLRQHAQRLANRLVYGKRATPYEALSQFSEHLSETYSHEDILDRMSRILAQGTGAERAEVWVRAGQRLVLASSSPSVSDLPPPLRERAGEGGTTAVAMQNGALPSMARDTVVPVSHQGELLGALAIDKRRGETLNTREQKLISDLAGQAGLVLKNVGLNQELLARLEDLRASRQRLVAAQDEERRRLERNLHDGAQQQLVALKIKVGLAEAVVERESKTRPILAQLKHDADEALDNLRELARGIYPPLLASDGLEAALRSQLRHFSVPTELQVDNLPRQPRETEGAVYFCFLEALQNVSKYAEASRVTLRLWVDGSRLAFVVEDDGKGFDPTSVVHSSGLQNMRDRLEALGGSLQLRSALGKGTTVRGTLPLNAES
jgi:signal transduction histidine kinase